MAKFDANSTLKRLQNRYRLVVMNDDTYEEVVTFKLSRMSVYITLSTIFVLLTGLTVALIVFTPLRLYIPGYGDVNATIPESHDPMEVTLEQALALIAERAAKGGGKKKKKKAAPKPKVPKPKVEAKPAKPAKKPAAKKKAAAKAKKKPEPVAGE